MVYNKCIQNLALQSWFLTKEPEVAESCKKAFEIKNLKGMKQKETRFLEDFWRILEGWQLYKATYLHEFFNLTHFVLIWSQIKCNVAARLKKIPNSAAELLTKMN